MDKWLEAVDSFLKEECIPSLHDFNLKSNSYSKTGYEVKRYIMPKTIEQLVSIIRFLRLNEIQFKVIGEMTNILFLDSVIYGTFISTKFLNRISFTEVNCSVEVGKFLPDLVREFAMRGYTGVEGLEGIPGGIGGAIFMNAGAYGYTVSDLIDRVECIDKNSNLIWLTKEELEFAKRESIFKKNNSLIITRAVFNLNIGDEKDIYRKIETYHIARHSYQEWVYPNLGSIYTFDGSVYDQLSKSRKIFRIKFFILKFLFFNKLIRLIRRKNPSNRILNRLVELDCSFSEYKDLFSHKNLNTFLNKNYASHVLLSFIFRLGRELGDSAILENEILIDYIYKIINQEEYEKCMSIIN
ncbi:FAD-binding protein [Paraglaciecola sp.]|uniref:FAD-binding protein n=1 Tax=Paraglaciecola sp. TaxID=1920173 RepID=UPI00273E003A|nr:FAD-binding protein [Paraglaciecola sp.]MDP5033263.1 FAD-binding protein [Paraglaciecola sp.]